MKEDLWNETQLDASACCRRWWRYYRLINFKSGIYTNEPSIGLLES